jgi:hypothetical protein
VIASADRSEQAAELPQIQEKAKKGDFDICVGHTKYYKGAGRLGTFPAEGFGSIEICP